MCLGHAVPQLCLAADKLLSSDIDTVLDMSYVHSSMSSAVAAGYRITACAATDDQCAFVLSQPRKILPDETQETLRTSQFPSQHVKV